MGYQISTDIGGTFTDLYIQNGAGEANSIKAPTTPDDPTEGLFDALEEAANAYDLSVTELLKETDNLIHGTTIATNAIIEDEVSKTGLIATEGFTNILLYREKGKPNPYEWHVDYPDPYISNALTFGVPERINAEGKVVTELDEDRVVEVIERLKEEEVDAVAVALLWSHVNGDHERRIGELIDEHAPDLHYSLSHEVNSIIREYRRTASTAIDASLHTVVDDYLTRLQEKLTENGFEGDPLIMTANGGVMQIDELATKPIWAVDSGPTMLPTASLYLAQEELDATDVIALDMGGTSLDMGVIQDGHIPRTREAEVGDDLLSIEKVDVKSIGSGGGSIAWVDDGGLLHVGPKSAGAQPGPVCYMRGGEEPTMTDAALTLGYLNEDYFLGGEMTVDANAAASAIEEKIGEPLGLDTTEAAHAIYSTANQNMVNGIKDVTIERGIDPRKYVLSGGGGALGMHAVALAKELQISELLLPKQAGVVSAFGGVVSDIRQDFSASLFVESDRFDHNGVNEVLADLEAKAEDFFERADIPDSQQTLSYHVQARYPQQVWELETELPGSRVDEGEEDVLVERFHQVHEDTFGYRTDQAVEFMYWRVEAVGLVDREVGATVETEGDLEAARHDQRKAYFDGSWIDSSAYRADRLAAGHTVEGPALVEAENTSVVVPPEAELTVTDLGSYHVTL